MRGKLRRGANAHANAHALQSGETKDKCKEYAASARMRMRTRLRVVKRKPDGGFDSGAFSGRDVINRQKKENLKRKMIIESVGIIN